MEVSIRSILVLTIFTCVCADQIDRGARTGVVLKMLREMVNQTKADTLNLPANATSIRENIVDTFSCENRSYGYYADVDNECQVFHVCLTSQGATGRNTTYRWSFICPKGTLFNQEYLVCTESRDSIPCEDAPLYYDLNMEIGKVPEPEDEKNDGANEMAPPPNKNVERIPVKNQKRPINRKKQNIIVEELMKEAMKQMEVINEDIVESQDVPVEETEEMPNEEDNNEAGIISLDRIIINDKTLEAMNNDKPVPDVEKENLIPVIVTSENKPKVLDSTNVFGGSDDVMEDARLIAERSLKRKGRKYRGSIKFRSDID